ncbi:PIN-like domain-containing protein [Bacillus wiedmannii]|uniref:PIN-like domain-containing protein n=1 Tax=Bacillus wiedmannii TaxID=1890302 RepID=UPI000BF3CCEC|nr:PIN-like domain-containing protein [Bacillus wiedmannii]PGE31568.1 hypothetical protein COM52_16775 [Bacillus wiedmannii]
MSDKWYPELNTIKDDSLIVFDTSVLLNVYRYSLISSKRILDHLRNSEDEIWLPNQVKEEFYKNRDKVRNFNLYNKLDVNLNKHVTDQKDKLLVQLSEYEKKRFSKFGELKDSLEKKYAEMSGIIQEYKNDIVEETEVYKGFIREVDEFLESILASKVGGKLGFKKLIEVLREGELRYEYNIPPGYEDAKTKEGINKFGDLIMWKEILEKTGVISEKNVIFVTSDTKSDWFRKRENSVIGPREELISEFKQYHPEKEVIIIPFENYIEEISDSLNGTDKELLLELSMNGLFKRLPEELFKSTVESKIQSINTNDLLEKLRKNTDDTKHVSIYQILEVIGPHIENVKVQPKGIKIIERDVVYSINVIVECNYATVSYSPGIESHGSIYTDVTVGVELRRKLEETEELFIDNFKKNPATLTKVTHCITENEEYVWGSDYDIAEDYYTSCGDCGEAINAMNDAGNGYCTNCSK